MLSKVQPFIFQTKPVASSFIFKRVDLSEPQDTIEPYKEINRERFKIKHATSHG